MSRRKQAKPIRLQDGEDENGMPIDVERPASYGSEEGDNGPYDQDMEDESFNDNNNHEDMEDDHDADKNGIISLENTSDIKNKLLKMNIGGLSGLTLPPNVNCDSAEANDQLQNISLTISQLTANLAKVANPNNIQELSVLQATLMSLQQQQLMQLHLISSMQNKMGGKKEEDEEDDIDAKDEEVEEIDNNCIPSSKESLDEIRNDIKVRNEDKPIFHRSNFEVKGDASLFPVPPSNNIPAYPRLRIMGSESQPIVSTRPPTFPTNSVADSLASTIITDHGPVSEKPVNTLELLQQKTQGILNNASKGVLANNLADLSATPHPGSQERTGEGNIKHRCRYCGKVFGSDSALSIHIRSHTGERPYKCNVCGNRFTTKGNLKVHFSRHSDRFPHIKMNPNMVPEHVDKFYPALLQQCEEAEKKGLPMPNINNPMAGMAPVVPPGMTLPTNLPGMSLPSPSLPPPMSMPPQPLRLPQHPMPPNLPHNLRLPNFPSPHIKIPLTFGALPRYPLPTEPIKREDIFNEKPDFLRHAPLIIDERKEPSMKREIKEEEECEELLPHEFLEPEIFINRDQSSTPKSLDLSDRRDSGTGDDERDERDEQDLRDESMGPKMNSSHSSDDGSIQDEPENLSGFKREDGPPPLNMDNIFDRFKFGPSMGPLTRLPQFPLPPNFNGMSPLLRPPISMAPFTMSPRGPLSFPPMIDATKDPNIYNNLLPRPGSTDNSWETLIEVDKSNETAKLEALVNNIESKMTDPNECVLCHRVLSCKSALQMHYRIHTGERPFKCKICNRSFTTKGNLKTHMGVHRSKPPIRSFPQCPVCHKKYANALVLQQHIRTHTGERTELSLEQIAAAEIKEFHPGHPGNIPLGLPTIRPPGDSLNKFLPQFPILTSPRGLGPNFDEDHSDEKHSRPSSVSSSASHGSTFNPSSGIPYHSTYSSSFSASLAALEKQVRTIDTMPKISIDDSRQFGIVRPFSREMSPDNKSEEPEDLSKPNQSLSGSHDNTNRSSEECPNSPTHSSSPHSGSNFDQEDSMDQRDEDPIITNATDREDNNSPIAAPSQSPDLPRLLPPLPQTPLDLTPISSGIPGFPPGHLPPHLFPAFPTPLSQLASTVSLPNLPNLPGFPHFAFPLPGMRPQLMEDIFAARGKTTCQVCFKVFACNSALEIHMRSHTKERPFKCDSCGKGFTTKGNMKQHAMTHKFQDAMDAGMEPGMEQHTPVSSPSSSEPGLTIRTEPDMEMTTSMSSPSHPVSPPFPTTGLKRASEDSAHDHGVALGARPPEKRAILCG